MLAVAVDLSPSFSFGKPRTLFTQSYLFGTTEGQEYDVARNGKSFLMMKPQEDTRRPTPLGAILNWFDDLRRRSPIPGTAASQR
jgi:hypothetical protein